MKTKLAAGAKRVPTRIELAVRTHLRTMVAAPSARFASRFIDESH